MDKLITEVNIETESAVGSFSTFQRRIEFHPARKPVFGFSNGSGGGGGDSGDFKLETLNASCSDHTKHGSVQCRGEQPAKKDGSELWDNGLDPELCFGMTFRRIGAGLENLGNTCFLNSVLQCLTYTEPLAAYLQSGKHQNSCHIAGFCALCAIQKHVSHALQAPGRILAPKDLVLNLRCISRNFRISRQEDAHEYMVNLLESMHKCCLPSGVPSESPSAYEKSLVHKIFGGRLCSQVKCTQCSYCSNKFDPFLDLSLEIAKAESVHKALNNFTAAELLDGGEKQYQCQRCKQKVRAFKQLSVHKAPYVLTVHLKRFRAYDPGQKIDKKVQFGPTLDMKPFVSGSYEGDLKYTLYGVLVHHGWSTHSGHYYCFVRTSSGMWYSLDDNRVVQVNERSVLEQKAYMLFYVRDRKNFVPRNPVDVAQKDNMKANVSGNKVSSIVSQPPKGHPQSCPTEHGVHGVDFATSAKHKNAVNGGLSKEIHENETSAKPGQALVQYSMPRKDASLEPASRVKNPSKELAAPNLDQGKSSEPSVQSVNSNGVSLEIKNNIAHAAAGIINPKENAISINDVEVSLTTLPNHNGPPQSSATNNLVTNGTSQQIILVSNGGASSITLRDPNDKKLERISYMPPSGDSSDKMVEKTCTLKSPNEPRNENIQVGSNSNNSIACNSPNKQAGDNVQGLGPELDKLSTPSVMKTESLNVKSCDVRHQRKLKKKVSKCQIRNMPIGLKFFKQSLGLHKKKHKKSKRRLLDPKNLSKKLLLDNNCSEDAGPSKSENTSKFSISRCHSKGKVVNRTSQKDTKVCNGDSLLNGLNGELKERIHPNSAVLATDEQLPKHSDSVLEATHRDATEAFSSKDSRNNLLQEGMRKLTRGLKETTIARWDGIDLHPQNLESDSNGSLRIGYVLDEWDEEYDRGKRKKLRRFKHSFSEPNPFQEIASKKTQLKNAKMSPTNSGDHPFRI